MIRALYSAASGMQAQQLNVDVIANNLANVNTAGFKQSRSEFQDLLYQNVRASGASSSTQTELPTGLQVGLGSRPVATSRLFTQGDFRQTSNPLDMVIEGQGFFQVRQPSGQIAYTRSGAFHLNREGAIVTSDGNPLDPQVTIPNDAQTITIGTDGTVSVTQPNQAQAQQVGTIQLANFQNPAGLNSIGHSLFLPTSSSRGSDHGNSRRKRLGQHQSGFHRTIERECCGRDGEHGGGPACLRNQFKVVQTADDMLQTMNNVVR